MSDKVAQLIGGAARDGQTARGVLEVIRALEQDRACVVFLGRDLDRPELGEPVRELAGRRRVLVIERYTRADLGRWSGLERPCAGVALLEVGKPAELWAEVLEGAAPRTVGAMQRLMKELRPEATAADALETARAALGRLESGSAQMAAAAELLRAALLLANASGGQLESHVLRWSLAHWLAVDEPSR